MRSFGNKKPEMSSTSTTTDRIAAIIRKDLMLGPHIELAHETVLFGGDLDLDSLDALLLVQSIEKDFGIKVSTDAIGPEVFATLATLTEFVEAQSLSQAEA